MILNMVQSVAEAHGTGITLTVDPDVSQVMAVETCFIIAGMIWRQGVHLKLPVQWALLYSTACNSSSERGEEEAVGVFGARVGEVSDKSLQYHSTLSANAGIPN